MLPTVRLKLLGSPCSRKSLLYAKYARFGLSAERSSSSSCFARTLSKTAEPHTLVPDSAVNNLEPLTRRRLTGDFSLCWTGSHRLPHAAQDPRPAGALRRPQCLCIPRRLYWSDCTMSSVRCVSPRAARFDLAQVDPPRRRVPRNCAATSGIPAKSNGAARAGHSLRTCGKSSNRPSWTRSRAN